jgi:hypothetical protein
MLPSYESGDKECGAPLKHGRPLDLEPHVHDPIIRGCDVEHGHRPFATMTELPIRYVWLSVHCEAFGNGNDD